MKNKIYSICALVLILMFVSCHKMDLNPLSEGASGTWYSNETELDESLNYLFKTQWWSSRDFPRETSGLPYWKGYADDDFIARTTLQLVNSGDMNGQTPIVTLTWNYAYKLIASANAIIENIDNAESLAEVKRNFYLANARFVRAYMYGLLIFRYGDVPYYTKTLTIDESFALSRTAKETVLEGIYDDYDYAIDNLPESYSSGEISYATKGAVMAMKARIALYMGDYQTANDAAKSCMDLGIYSLHPDYSNLFLSSTKSSPEFVFTTARSLELNDVIYVREQLPRLRGGYSNGGPSWDLFCAFLCTDGLPIDESPLFNPQKPFENRDPRCNATIVEFGTRWLDFIYEPHPDSLTVWDYSKQAYVGNQDSRGVQLYCSYNALILKKFIDTWLANNADNVNIMMRYADVLLIYAEAKIELGDIDQSVLDAMNMVRARAYGVDKSATSEYPAITTTSQSELRKTLRIERRMEFAWEGWRYDDLIRWKLAEKALTKKVYGILDPDELREKLVNKGLWFFPSTPPIDEDGLPDLDPMFNAGLCKLLAVRAFDAARNYLWPIPTSEIQINPNLVQNTGY